MAKKWEHLEFVIIPKKATHTVGIGDLGTVSSRLAKGLCEMGILPGEFIILPFPIETVKDHGAERDAGEGRFASMRFHALVYREPEEAWSMHIEI